ncbi:hypothetical protein GCM10011344_44020 [Dokdonia pacifica]|uniref:Uncharacterized membrane protein n=1 Tax=Dokdonia pacifica TaxID=1627892 RepID=A0A239CK77_9FLAO|nr:hypothetical protein [Dokdonia pacifica]GGG38354.1 hypothetical protein GCM10011344_44020 [Dokdonia pacifica]SNS20081.1 Uncharacterized membrane protein [Dokdonia pacifica]
MDQNTIFEGKTAAVWSYFSFLGLLIAFSMNSEPKNPFAAFHIRQSLGLTLLFILLTLPLGFFDTWLVSGPFLITFFVLWLYGIISAFQGHTQPIPLVGELFQKVFTKK